MESTPEPTATAETLRTAMEVAYESASDLLVPGVLDVYAPPSGGPWPVVVMFHGTPSSVSKDFLTEHARRVANLGFVVFDAAWGHLPGGKTEMDAEPISFATAGNAQTACAIAYARSTAADYGGDPSKLIVFGHSGGSNTGSVVAFGGGKPSKHCLGGQTMGEVDALVTWEGNFMLAPEFDPILAAQPRLMDLLTPWSALDRRRDLPVSMLLSDNPGGVDSGVAAAMPADQVAGFLALRDKDGMLKRLTDKTNAFADGVYSVADEQRVLYEALKEQGNPVTLDIMPGSSHLTLSDEGWKVFLAAFAKAAARLGLASG